MEGGLAWVGGVPASVGGGWWPWVVALIAEAVWPEGQKWGEDNSSEVAPALEGAPSGIGGSGPAEKRYLELCTYLS